MKPSRLDKLEKLVTEYSYVTAKLDEGVDLIEIWGDRGDGQVLLEIIENVNGVWTHKATVTPDIVNFSRHWKN